MKKSSRLPKHLQSVKKKCPVCGTKNLMQNKFTKDWVCQKCKYTHKKVVEFVVKSRTQRYESVHSQGQPELPERL